MPHCHFRKIATVSHFRLVLINGSKNGPKFYSKVRIYTNCRNVPIIVVGDILILTRTYIQQWFWDYLYHLLLDTFRKGCSYKFWWFGQKSQIIKMAAVLLGENVKHPWCIARGDISECWWYVLAWHRKWCLNPQPHQSDIIPTIN